MRSGSLVSSASNLLRSLRGEGDVVDPAVTNEARAINDELEAMRAMLRAGLAPVLKQQSPADGSASSPRQG